MRFFACSRTTKGEVVLCVVVIIVTCATCLHTNAVTILKWGEILIRIVITLRNFSVKSYPIKEKCPRFAVSGDTKISSVNYFILLFCGPSQISL